MSSMTPKNREEYDKRYQENLKFTGSGLDTTTHYPCPFCAAPDWVKVKILDTQEKLSKEHTCIECNRGARFVYQVGNITKISLQQTSGPDPDSWMGWVRREDDAAG